jgi:dTDP-4-amino-4,6-dideoxygalactose transaminase
MGTDWNIPLFKVFMSPTVIEDLTPILYSGMVGQGPQVDKFEAQLRKQLQCDYPVTVQTATSALSLALHLLGVQGKNDQVISTPLTCIATNIPIYHTGATMVWADTDPRTLNISPWSVAEKVTADTKAIMVMHWGGTPCDTDLIRELCILKHGFCPPIIEDAAQALGAEYKGKPIGSHGNYCAISLQAVKTITSIDGGILCVPRHEYRRALLLRWYGINRDEKRHQDFRAEIDVEQCGFKYHMNDVIATIGMSNLKHLSELLDTTRANAAAYDTSLRNIGGIELLRRDSDANSSFWLYSFLAEDRMDLQRKLQEKGIAASRVHERNDLHTCFAHTRCDLPQLDSVYNKILCIPVGWWVTEEERSVIIDTIKEG